jgi:hypothetical protein
MAASLWSRPSSSCARLANPPQQPTRPKRRAAERQRRWADGGEVRFLIYFLPPVPLALFGLLVGMLTRGIPASAEGLPQIVTFGLVGGYVSMGLQSALFAVGMLWLERRGVARSTRCIAAAVAGGLAGATLGLVPARPLPVVFFVTLGASTGAATSLFAGLVLVASSPSNKPRRHVGPKLLAILAVPGLGGTAGTITYDLWVEAARQSVLADVAIGMSCDDVVRVAGAPTHDSRIVAFFLPTEAVDVVWMYDRPDPGSAAVLVVAVSFKDERVVELRRTPVWRD